MPELQNARKNKYLQILSIPSLDSVSMEGLST